MKYFSALLQVLIFGAAIAFSITSLQPSITSTKNNTNFNVDNALVHVKEIAQKPHYTGSEEHALVRNYLVSELENLGLEPHLQSGFSTTYFKGLSIAVPENILAKIEGKNPDEPALVLMSHYDTAVHSAVGAADAASGVAAILESVRVYLEQGEQPNQDIIILFTDTEEVGLNGANLFVKEHPWAENIGLVLNFEARGSSGPSSMILEVNGGNKNLINHFANANIQQPFANSLMYSVYKLLPNDTDSTVFRTEADVPSFFFAFIDKHFNYHTALDTVEHLDIHSLNQQGEYALSLLNYFSNTPLANLNSTKDHVYFNFPFVGIIHFSTSLALGFIILSFLGLLLLVHIGIRKNRIDLQLIGKSFIFILSSLLLSFLIGYFGWKIIAYLYPDYNLILQGFPYNAFSYIIAFVSLIVAGYFRLFYKYSQTLSLSNFLPAAIFIWLVLSLLAYLYLPGASYFVIPAFFGLLILTSLVILKTNNQTLHFILCLPVLFLIVPFVHFFPIGLGISLIFISCVLSVLILLLISPLLYNFRLLKGVAFLLFCTSLFFFGRAHINSSFNSSQPRPSSLVYFQDEGQNKAYWASYDPSLSTWNSTYFKDEFETKAKINFESKYANRFAHFASAENMAIPTSIVDVQKLNETVNQKTFKFYIKPKRNINRYEMFFDTPISLSNVKVNGELQDFGFEDGVQPKITRFLNYYVANQEALEVEFTVDTDETFNVVVYESAFNLINHPELKVPERPSTEIPMPFVLNDATIVSYTIPF